MILQHQPKDMPLGFKVRRRGGNWRLTNAKGKRFDGRFQQITEPPPGMSGKNESTVKKFVSAFS